MSNVYENLGSGNFNSHIDDDRQNGGMIIDNKPTIGHEIKKTLIKAGAAGLAMGSLGMAAACAPTEAATPNPEPTQIVVVDNSGGMAIHTSNEASTETIETTPSPIPTEAPTPTIDQGEILAQKKQDFIDKTGEYTYENIKGKLFVEGFGDKRYDLGVVTYADEAFGQVVVQGWLFGYREENGNLILEVGFDNKDKTKGIIKDVVVPVEFYQQHLSDGVGLGFWNRELWQRFDSSSTSLGIKNDMSSIKNLLNPFEDKPMLFSFYSAPVSNIPGSEKYGEEVRDLENLFTENLSAVNSLLTEITDNDKKVKIGSTERSDSSSLMLVMVEACFD